MSNYCFVTHCEVHDSLLFALTSCGTVCHNFSSVHHSAKVYFSVMWSVDFFFFNLICFLLCFDQVFPQLYFHMLRQRRKVLHGEVIVEKDDWIEPCNYGAFNGKTRVKKQNFLWFFWVQVLKHGTRINVYKVTWTVLFIQIIYHQNYLFIFGFTLIFNCSFLQTFSYFQ